MIATLYASFAPSTLISGAAGPLRDDTVHVWRFASAQDVGRLAAVLSDDERRAAARFAARAHRDRYVVQRAMMRCLLARYADAEPHELRFARGPRGKPSLVGGGGLEFSLSHADDVALLAVAREIGLGVDIERLDAAIEHASLAPIVLAPAEVSACTDRRAFLRIWCRKEACLKATGVGLLDDLTTVSVVEQCVDVCGSIVYVRDLAAGATHAAALATTVPCAEIAPVELETFATS